MKTVDSRTVIALFGDAVGEVLAAVLEKQTSVAMTTDTPEPGYVVVVEARRGGRGMLQMHFDRSQAEALAKRMIGTGVDPDQAAVLGSLKEVCGQAATTLAEKYPGSGAQLEVASAQLWTESPQWATATAVEVSFEGEPFTLRAEITATLEIMPDGDRAAHEEVRTGESPNIDVILDIDLPLVVRFGRTEMSLKDLTALGPGSLINLGRSPDDPVDVLVSNQVVARGEVVTVAGSYGVRIRDVVSPAERVRSVEVSL